eukprot:scaffold279011_cov28-Tisochrysis_lutea.AAC.3
MAEQHQPHFPRASWSQLCRRWHASFQSQALVEHDDRAVRAVCLGSLDCSHRVHEAFNLQSVALPWRARVIKLGHEQAVRAELRTCPPDQQKIDALGMVSRSVHPRPRRPRTTSAVGA